MTKILLPLCAGLLLCGVWASAMAQDSDRRSSPEGASAYIITPENGAITGTSVVVRFGLHGMGVAPAGTDVTNTGHHHLIIDSELPPLGEPIPDDQNHRHFGGGQTEITLALAPGQHTLQLLLGDWIHMPHEPPVTSQMVTITVTE